MKKTFLSLFLLVFSVLPNKAAAFNYEKLKNLIVEFVMIKNHNTTQKLKTLSHLKP